MLSSVARMHTFLKDSGLRNFRHLGSLKRSDKLCHVLPTFLYINKSYTSAMADSSSLKQIACSTIENRKEELNQLSQKIWCNPELKYEEHQAHDLLTGFLEKERFKVERNHHLPTAFKAIYESGLGVTVAVICEYDALPEIGHACGHNLIAELGVAASLGIKAALEQSNSKLGKLVVLGTPAEEMGGGKIDLINAGAFSDIDIAMMAHPKAFDISRPIALANAIVTVRYRGRPAHASSLPWMGLNALDAAVMCYQGIACMRQQMKPTCRIHGIITNGGAAANVIPELTELEFMVRGPTVVEVEELKKKAIQCFEAAATMTGCTVELEWVPNAYANMVTNSTLISLYEENASKLGWHHHTEGKPELKTSGSTDMGNVSYVVPSIHPFFNIGTDVSNHSRVFTEVAGSPGAQPYTLRAAKALAMTALDVLSQPQLINRIKEDFQKDLETNSS
ncbi:peptidase M20 domain-containing protein 2 [Lingula anatina]|uniref:Peptidase M20 domain-containing protein 2 n=1 Tax=Lingula anatina TaxID=7574 RepID=A0A1S3IZZ2_LINAN|nr:peptidase M20 domain-containing protein 2 [Lingula anatina]|eukprot:XP_013403765.1 peptidase M20 domain-containing protein 2 [Lingula anatina]